MKLLAVAAMGAALVAGCAPFEHGHYAQDVSYRNTAGDPPGTPLIVSAESFREPQSTNFARTARADEWRHAPHNALHHAPAFSQQPVAYAQPQSFVAPVQQAFAAPVQQPVFTQVAQPTLAAAVQPTFTQVGAAPAFSAPVVQQSYVPQPVHHVQPALQSTFAAAAPLHQPSVHATSFGGVRLDAEGYAICDIPGAHHAAHHHVPQYRARF